MATSPSEKLRKQLPHLRNVLQSRIDEANDVLGLQLPHDDQEIAELQEKITACIGLLSSPVTKIKDIDQMWEAELTILTAENEKEEFKLYEDIAVDWENGYYRLLYEADGVFCRLRARYSRLQGRRQNGSVGISSSQSAGCVLVPHPCPGAGLVPEFPTSHGQKTIGGPFQTTNTQESIPPNDDAGSPPIAGAPTNASGNLPQPKSQGNASAAGAASPMGSGQTHHSAFVAHTDTGHTNGTTDSNHGGHQQGDGIRRGGVHIGANGGGNGKRSRAHRGKSRIKRQRINQRLRLFRRHSGPGRCGAGGNQSGSYGEYQMDPSGPGPTLSPQTTRGVLGLQPGAFGPIPSPQTGPEGFNHKPGGSGGGGSQASPGPGGFNLLDAPAQLRKGSFRNGWFSFIRCSAHHLAAARLMYAAHPPSRKLNFFNLTKSANFRREACFARGGYVVGQDGGVHSLIDSSWIPERSAIEYCSVKTCVSASDVNQHGSDDSPPKQGCQVSVDGSDDDGHIPVRCCCFHRLSYLCSTTDADAMRMHRVMSTRTIN